MHKNRQKYSFTEYKRIAEEREKNFCLLLRNKETAETKIVNVVNKSYWTTKQRLAKAEQQKPMLKRMLKKHPFRMVTLTYSTKIYSITKALKLHKIHINKYFKALRKLDNTIKYCYFIELTDKFYPHFHCLIKTNISKTKLKKIWFNITRNYIVDVRKVYSQDAARYLTKYLVEDYATESLAEQKLSIIFKNISRLFVKSRNFLDPEFREVKETLYDLLCYLNIADDIIKAHLQNVSEEGYIYVLQLLELASMSPPPCRKLNNISFIDVTLDNLDLIKVKFNCYR